MASSVFMDTRRQYLVSLLWTLFGFVWCACDIKEALKSNTEKELTSPNYPANFSPNQRCFYDLTTESSSGDILHLFVLDVTLSCGDKNTSLEVFDGFSGRPRSLGKVCSGGSTKLVSPKNKLYLVFKSGSADVTSRGFKINIISVPEFTHCYNHQAKVLTVLPESQYIVSPYYPYEVAPNVHCRWLLKAAPGYRVHLDIVSADMKGSNDCFNFGLRIFDGKTTYDDEMLGSVCSNHIRRFQSNSNYLMVVFSSGPHVLHSGGGVKLAFYSSLADPDAVEKDSSLLFIVIGILLGVASFTIMMIVLRFFVIPARKKALARRYNPAHRGSSGASTSVATISLPNEPPPPYNSTEVTRHQGSRAGIHFSSCLCCFGGDKRHRRHRRHTDPAIFSNDFTFTHGDEISYQHTDNSLHIISPPNETSLTENYNQHSREGRNFSENSAREITRTNITLNDYQDLPRLSDNTNTVSEEFNTAYVSINSGYQTDSRAEERSGGNTASHEDLDIQAALSCLDNAKIYENTSMNSFDPESSESKDDNCIPGNATVDENGYEIPSLVRPPQSASQEDKDEDDDVIYHNLPE